MVTPRAGMEGSLIKVTDISDSCGGMEVWTRVSAQSQAHAKDQAPAHTGRGKTPDWQGPLLS